jgi:hypothetical protein
MVESLIMEEARQRGVEYMFEGTVGMLDEIVMQLGPDITRKASERPVQWVLESVNVNVEGSGLAYTVTDAQAGSPQMTPVAAEEERLRNRLVPVASGGFSNHQAEDIELADLEEKSSFGKKDSQQISLQDAKEPKHDTRRNMNSSDHHSKNILLVPPPGGAGIRFRAYISENRKNTRIASHQQYYNIAPLTRSRNRARTPDRPTNRP